MRNEPRRRRYNGVSIDSKSEEDPLHPTSSGLPVTKIKKRRRTNNASEWVKMIVVFCVVRALLHFIRFTHYSNDYFQVVHYPIEFTAPMLRSSSRELYQLDYAKLKRRSRTTPQSITIGSRFSFLSQISAVDTDSKSIAKKMMGEVITIDSTYPSFSTTDYVAGDDVCGYKTIDRVLISGIFSHPVATELALTLAELCGVHHIVGISDHFLNTEESSRLEFLLRRIPNLQLKVQRGPLGERATERLFESFLPSHVFYFQSDSFRISSRDDDDKEGTFLTHGGTDQLEQICNTMVKMQSKPENKENKTTLLYVTSNFSKTNSSDAMKLSEMMISKSNRIRLNTYRIHYQLDVRELSLPYIFGPFREGAHWLLSDNFIYRAENQYSKNSKPKITTDTSFITQPTISVTDAIRSILVSGKLGHVRNYESTPILAASKSQTTRLLDLSQTLIPISTSSVISSTVKDSLDMPLFPVLSWSYKQAKPYRDPSANATLGLINTRHRLIEEERIKHASISQLERRQHDLFPCVSACASFVKCRSSIWDPIVSITKNITDGCDFVLYMANFSQTLEDLPIMREATNNAPWPKDSFCQLAFVSSTSPLVKNAIQKKVQLEGDKVSENVTAENFNGQVFLNDWTLVWVDKNEEFLSQADSMMPKIVPESILNPSVQFVWYIEPHHFEILPPLQIMWFLMARQLTSRAQRKDDKSGANKEWLIPERRIEFFTHSYNESIIQHLDQTKADFIPRAAEFILEQNGKSKKDQGKAFRNFSTTRQSKAYASSLMWQKEGGLKFELIDTPLMIFPIRNFRGTQFRCEWYEEHLFWSNENNQHLEGLSLSYVLHRWRRRGMLLRNTDDDKWGEMMLLGGNGEQISPSAIKFKKLLKKGDNEKEADSLSDAQHFLKVHSSLLVRKTYAS